MIWPDRKTTISGVDIVVFCFRTSYAKLCVRSPAKKVKVSTVFGENFACGKYFSMVFLLLVGWFPCGWGKG